MQRAEMNVPRPPTAAVRGLAAARAGRLARGAATGTFPLLHLIFSYCAEGCMARCMRDHILKVLSSGGEGRGRRARLARAAGGAVGEARVARHGADLPRAASRGHHQPWASLPLCTVPGCHWLSILRVYIVALLSLVVLAVQMKDSSCLGITLNADKAWNSLVKKVGGTQL